MDKKIRDYYDNFDSKGSDMLNNELIALIMVCFMLTCIVAMVIIGTYFKNKL
jgi:hypothetical protein